MSTIVDSRVSVCYLDSLPYELLLKICSMLSNKVKLQLKTVSRRLYLVANDRLLWKHIHWSHFTSSDLPSLRHLLFQFSDIITVLCVSGNVSRILELKVHILCCQRLKALSLVGVPQNIDAVKSLVAGLPNLANLEIEPSNSTCSMLQCAHVVCSSAEWKEFLTAVAHIASLSVVIPLSHSIAQFFLSVWATHNYYPLQFRVCVFSSEIPSDISSWNTECGRFLALWRESQYTMPSCDHSAQFRLGLYRPCIDSPSVELNLQPSPTAVQTALALGQLDRLESGAVRMSGAELGSEAYSMGHYTPADQLCLAENEALMKSLQAYDTSKLKYLNFSEAIGLLSVHLEAIAESCPLLTRLNLKGCKSSLATFFGIAAIADKCRELNAINLCCISKRDIEDLEELWRLLSQIGKLKHLAVNPCIIPEQSALSSADKDANVCGDLIVKRLSAVEYHAPKTRCPSCIVSMENVHCVWVHSNLAHLRVEGLSASYCGAVVTSALTHCRSLKSLFVDSDWCFSLPLKPQAYSNLEQLCLKCRRMNVSYDFIRVLTEVDKLTHLYLFVRSISKSSINEILEKLTRLVTCHIYCRDRPVMQPPNAALFFSKRIKELTSARTQSLDDFIFEEETSSHLYVHKLTAKSLLNSDLVSVW